jgi:SAM-dependent methyltransferase
LAATERYQSELAFHDRQACERAATFSCRPSAYQFADASYLDHETWIRPAFLALGELWGKAALDFGCGHGMAAIVMARAGAEVTAFDLSPGYLREARARAAANGVPIRFLLADGEKLPFPDASFDRIWGNAVLHHLDVEAGAREIRRVLRPGGWAVFCEPWGENRFLNWARDRAAYSRKERTRDEQPLRRGHLQAFRRTFGQVDVRGFQFLGMARRVLAPGRIVTALDWCDGILLSRNPHLEQYCRYVVLTLHR